MPRWLTALAVYREPRIIAVMLLGFSSGMPLVLTGTTLAAWLTEEGLSLGTIGLFASVGTPYALKFLWSPMMDRMPLGPITRAFGRRRGWLLTTQVILIAAILALAVSDPVNNIGVTALLAVTVAFMSASQDIVIDAYRIEILEERQLAAGAAVYVYGYRIAMVVSGAGALYLATYVSWSTTYMLMTLGIALGMAVVLLNPEPKTTVTDDLAERQAQVDAWVARHPTLPKPAATTAGFLYTGVVAPFAEFMLRPGWLVILLFVMFYKFGDSLAGVMTTPFLLKIGFTKIDIANVVKLFGTAATFAGLFLGGWMMNALGLYRSLWICGVLQLVSNFMFAVQAMVGADMAVLAVTIGLENLAGGMGTAVFVAYLSSLCNLSYTATQYALLTSFMATARTWFSSSGGYLADWLGWVDFFLLTAAAALPGLILLWWLTRRGSETRPALQGEAGDG